MPGMYAATWAFPKEQWNKGCWEVCWEVSPERDVGPGLERAAFYFCSRVVGTQVFVMLFLCLFVCLEYFIKNF